MTNAPKSANFWGHCFLSEGLFILTNKEKAIA